MVGLETIIRTQSGIIRACSTLIMSEMSMATLSVAADYSHVFSFLFEDSVVLVVGVGDYWMPLDQIWHYAPINIKPHYPHRGEGGARVGI